MKRQIDIIGKIDIGPGSTWANVCWVFVVAITGLAIFLLSANFSRREQVGGFLTADPQIVRINAPRAGRVQRIAIPEGQQVKRGDVLIYIDPEPVLVNGKPAAQAEIDHLRISERELRTRIRSINSQVSMKIAELTERADAVTKQISALRKGVELQQQTVTVLRKQLAVGRALEQSGALSAVEIQKRETNLRDAEISAQNLLFSLHENEALLAELNGQRIQAPVEGEVRLSDLRQSLIELEQRRTDAEGRLAFQVTAPVDGTVDTILIATGQSVDTTTTLISLLPQTSTLAAELYVPSRAVAFVQAGQSVRIAYNAFPYVRYGFAEGKITSISETILRPDELQKTITVVEPSYRVTVSLQKQTMEAGSREVPLRPGLTLNADIILDRQTLAQWVFHSIRELWART